MKAGRFTTSVSSILLAGAILVPNPQGIKPRMRPHVSYFTGTETMGAIVEWGELYITERGNILIRGMVREMFESSDDDRITGHSLVVINANLKPDGSGQIWGTYEAFSVIEGGTWDGTWVGRVFSDGSQYIWGRAKGMGTFRGLKSAFWTQYPVPVDPTYMVGDIRGIIYGRQHGDH